MARQTRLDLAVPVSENDLFHFDDTHVNFDALAHDNGFRYWYASDLMRALGYQSFPSFQKAVNRALTACGTLNIPQIENFTQEPREVDGKQVADWRLSRFACYLVAMNADPKKPEVARAQAYFAVLAESFRRYVEEAEDVERVLDREELSQAEKSLASAAKGAQVREFSLFQNAGYRGMYNMNLGQLKARRGTPGRRSVLDFAGPEEMAANRFRVTQTGAKLRNEQIHGDTAAQRAAEEVGREVRATMMRLSNTRPEDLPVYEDIRKVQSAIKSSSREFAKLDRAKK